MPNFKDRYNPAFGELNPIEEKFVRPNYDSNTSTFLGIISYSAEKSYSKKINNLPTMFKGIVLRINKANKHQPLNSFLSRNPVYDSQNPLITINVRIPELHSTLPNPLSYGSNPSQEQYLINMYPEFVALDENLSNNLPTKGDIVYVSFGNIENFTEPMYHGLVYSKPTPGVVKQTSNLSAGDAFRKNINLKSLNALEVQQEIEKLISEPIIASREYTYIRGEPQEEIDLVEMPLDFATKSGLMVRKEYYEDILQMLKDASAEGHKIKLKSGFRSYNQQKYLYQKYQRGEGNLAANPDRAGPNSHLTGKSYDFTGTKNGRSSIFVWLALNAHKYGLFNEGATFNTQPESWHWSYRGKDSSVVKAYGNLTLRQKTKPFRDFYG